MRLLRLLQASGAPLSPHACVWGSPTLISIGTAEAGGPSATAPKIPGTEAVAQSRRGWNQLMKTFESRRLKASIEAFPIERGLQPPPFDFEVWSDRGVDGESEEQDGSKVVEGSILTRRTGKENHVAAHGPGASRSKQDEGEKEVMAVGGWGWSGGVPA